MSILSKIISATPIGISSQLIDIEVHQGLGEPKISIVGLPDTAVRESRDRVSAALHSGSFKRPKGKTTINLAPADLKKEGSGFDLPIAMGIIANCEELAPEKFTDCLLVGELALNGDLRAIRGLLSIALEAKRNNIKRIICPKSVAAQASVVEGIEVYGVTNLREAYRFLIGEIELSPEVNRSTEFFTTASRYEIDFTDVKGQEHVKRAIEIAVAGAHNLLMIGPPGTGKSMIAKRIVTIMPSMTEEEAIETTRIHSVAGLLGENSHFIAIRPFRSPHHTISDIGLLGGGSKPGPGEVSIAHHGILFMDELPEFRRGTLEVLRQPIEDGKVSISRAAGKMDYPAQFMLVAAMNPCPCGYHGDDRRECRCTPKQIAQYRQRISGPLLDRIDLHLEVPRIEYKELSSEMVGESSDAIRKRVETARAIQETRQGKSPGQSASAQKTSTNFCNSALSPKQVKEHCRIDQESDLLLEQAMNDLNFSARAHDRILKVARTIADLSGSEDILSEHILEAVQYRSLDRSLWN